MDKEVKQKADFYRFVAWAHANRKRLIWISAIVVIVGGGIGVYSLYKSNRETEANNALSNINPPSSPDELTNAALAEPYLKVAADYPGTRAAARSLLLAGGFYFDAGKFPEAQKQFEQFLADYADYPLADQALMGVAKCYEAEGKLTDAATKYREFIDHHPTASTVTDARSALARVYLAENKPELALQEYEQLQQARNNDTWTAEAGIQREELLTKYPNLRKQPAALPTTAPQIINIPTKALTSSPAASSNSPVPAPKPVKP